MSTHLNQTQVCGGASLIQLLILIGTPTLSGNDVVWCGCNHGYLPPPPKKKVGKKLDYMLKYYCRFSGQTYVYDHFISTRISHFGNE
jgi:hypothetical protein